MSDEGALIKPNPSIKASFYNVKSEMQGPTCYQCL